MISVPPASTRARSPCLSSQPVEKELISSLQEPDPPIRAAVADVLGAIGGDASLAALQGLQDKDKMAADAVSRAVERIRMRRPQ